MRLHRGLFARTDKRGALVTVHHLSALVGNPAARTPAPQCRGECGKPCSKTRPPPLPCPTAFRGNPLILRVRLA